MQLSAAEMEGEDQPVDEDYTDGIWWSLGGCGWPTLVEELPTVNDTTFGQNWISDYRGCADSGWVASF